MAEGDGAGVAGVRGRLEIGDLKFQREKGRGEARSEGRNLKVAEEWDEWDEWGVGGGRKLSRSVP
jgi:hypothetical protein